MSSSAIDESHIAEGGSSAGRKSICTQKMDSLRVVKTHPQNIVSKYDKYVSVLAPNVLFFTFAKTTE